MTEPMNRVAVITTLAEQTPQLGRTSLMKFCYFLQTLRKVPLGYKFSLYSYGPFDSDVLADLDAAEAIGGVTSSVVSYANSYGYKIEPGTRAHAVKARNSKFLDSYQPDIEWVLENFGMMSAAELELASTLIFSDREAKAYGEVLSTAELASRVREIKPHFSLEQIKSAASNLKMLRLLVAAQ